MKKITLINGITDDNYSSFEEKLASLCNKSNEQVKYECITLRQKKINYCCGCWDCWVKTPGECVFKDDIALSSVVFS